MNYYGDLTTPPKNAPDKKEEAPSCSACLHHNRPACKSPAMKNCNRRVWERRDRMTDHLPDVGNMPSRTAKSGKGE